MPPRAFIASLAQETNAFAPLPTGLCEFDGRFEAPDGARSSSPPFPEAVLARGRALEAAGELVVVEGPSAGADPGGPVTRAAFEILRDGLLDAVSARAPLDIVALQLHGAMSAHGHPDCEGELLAAIRRAVGPRPFIGALLDPHAHLSARMMEAADILVAFKEYPHTDFNERAAELWHALLRAFRTGRRPAGALWDSGAIGIFHTGEPKVRELVEWMIARERAGDALSVSLIHGFPWGDCRDLGTRALVFTDGDEDAADTTARDLARRAAAVLRHARPHMVPLAAAVERIARLDPGGKPLVAADAPDNPGGGAAGDSTFVLRALLDAEVRDVCLGPIWDPMAARIAAGAGPGATLPLRIGGKTGPLSGAPVDVVATVVGVDEQARQLFAGEWFELGLAVAVETRGLGLVLTTRRDQARSPTLFTRLGLDLGAVRAVVVKSSEHFRAEFASIASEIIYLDAPGALQHDFGAIPYRAVQRPRFPIDPGPPKPWKVAGKAGGGGRDEA